MVQVQREPLGLLAAKGSIPWVTSQIFRLGDPEIKSVICRTGSIPKQGGGFKSICFFTPIWEDSHFD